MYIIFFGLGLQSSLPSDILSCLYSIALWSKFFEPCDLETLRVSADSWALKGQKILVKRPPDHDISHISMHARHLVSA